MSHIDRLQVLIVAAHKGGALDVSGMDADMLAYAKSEHARLRTRHPETMRLLAEHDYESKIRCLALERLLAAVEAPKKSG